MRASINTSNDASYQSISKNSNWFFFTALYITLDYTRIYQELHLGFTRPLMIVTLLLVYFIISSGEYYRAKSKQTTCIWLFVLLLACYIPFAHNNHFAYIITKGQLLYMPFIISTIIVVNSMARLKSFFLLLICCEIYIAVYALTHAGYGPGNYFGDENDLALYINMWIPFCYFLFFSYTEKLKKIICLIGLVVGLLAVIVSFSRGGFLGLIATGMTIWLFSKRKIISVLAIALLSGIVFLFAGQAYWAEMGTATNTEEGTAKGRIEAWKSGWNMFLDNPLGVGARNFMIRFPEYQTEYFQRGMWGREAHSLYFTLIPELGIIGIFIYLGLLHYNLKDIFMLKNIQFDKKDPDKRFLNYTGRAFAASLAGFFTSAAFLSVLYYAHYWYLMGLLVAATNVAKIYTEESSAGDEQFKL